jgi:Flp pilus assembly protein TadD
LCLGDTPNGLSLQPVLHEARRELVRANLETSDVANAQAELWRAIWLNPRDAWSLVTLAGLLVEGGEAAKAERLARTALELEPANRGARCFGAGAAPSWA